MSNLAVRNVLGTGAFAIPKTQKELEKTKNEWEKILKTVNGLIYKEVYVLILNTPNATESLHLNCGYFRFNKTIRPDPIGGIKNLRTYISDALYAHPGIISFDMVEIQMFTQSMDRELRRRKFLKNHYKLKRTREKELLRSRIKYN